MSAREIARYVAVALMGLGVLVATADGFAQSYSGLLGWAQEHGLRGWKADSFPLLIDTFVFVGELGLFLLALDGHRLRRSLLSWLDLLVPGLVAASGWGASLVFNVGRVQVHDFATEATAAVPPLASMVGLVVLLRTLHRYVAQESMVPALVDPETFVLEQDRDDVLDETTAATLAWFKGEKEPAILSADPALSAARERFSEVLAAGGVPSKRAIKRELKVGHDNAVKIHAALSKSA